MLEEKTMVNTQQVLGQVQYNDGEVAEIQTWGLDGMHTGLPLERIQQERDDTDDEAEDFQHKVRVGALLDITTTVEIKPSSKTDHDLDELDRANDEIQRRFELGEI
jgi:hypothetical protein